MSNEINTENTTVQRAVSNSQDQVNTRELQKPESGSVYDGLKDSALGNITMSEYKNSLGSMLNGSSHLPEASINKKDGTIDFSVSSDDSGTLPRAGKTDSTAAPNMVTDKPNKVDGNNNVYRMGDDGKLSLVNKQGNADDAKRPNKRELGDEGKKPVLSGDDSTLFNQLDGGKKPINSQDSSRPNKMEDSELGNGKKPVNSANSERPNKLEDLDGKKPLKGENSDLPNKKSGSADGKDLDKGGDMGGRSVQEVIEDGARKGDGRPNKVEDQAKKTKPDAPKPIDGREPNDRRAPRALPLAKPGQAEEILERAREAKRQSGAQIDGKDPNYHGDHMEKPNSTDEPNLQGAKPEGGAAVRPGDFVNPEAQSRDVFKQPSRDIYDGPAKRKYPLPTRTRK